MTPLPSNLRRQNLISIIPLPALAKNRLKKDSGGRQQQTIRTLANGTRNNDGGEDDSDMQVDMDHGNNQDNQPNHNQYQLVKNRYF